MNFTLPTLADISHSTLTQALQHKIDQKTKPLGSLGRLESLALQLGQILGTESPQLNAPQMLVCAGDHGLAARGVSAYPSDVTWQMVENFLAGGACVSVIARQHGIALTVVDCGVRHDFAPQAGLVNCKIAPGTADSFSGPAMTEAQCQQAISNGQELVKKLPGNAPQRREHERVPGDGQRHGHCVEFGVAGEARHHHDCQDVEKRRHGGGAHRAQRKSLRPELQRDDGESDEGVPARRALQQAGELRPIDLERCHYRTVKNQQEREHYNDRQHHGDGHLHDRNGRKIGGGDLLEDDRRKQHEVAKLIEGQPLFVTDHMEPPQGKADEDDDEDRSQGQEDGGHRSESSTAWRIQAAASLSIT